MNNTKYYLICHLLFNKKLDHDIQIIERFHVLDFFLDKSAFDQFQTRKKEREDKI